MYDYRVSQGEVGRCKHESFLQATHEFTGGAKDRGAGSLLLLPAEVGEVVGDGFDMMSPSSFVVGGLPPYGDDVSPV